MPTNWPPQSGTYPSWPPAEIATYSASYSDLRSLLRWLRRAGFTQESPTTEEQAAFFVNARCDHGHQVLGRMLVSPDALRRYPFAVCRDATHRDLLVLWEPYYCGARSGLE